MLGRRHGLGTMTYQAVGEFFAVSVWGKDYDYAHNDDKHPLHSFITYLEFASDPGDWKPKKDIDVPIDVDFAIAVQRAWATMLLKSRYPEKAFRGLDGWEVEFSVWVAGAGDIYGFAWSPEKGLPKELMDLGVSLGDYCKAPESERLGRHDKLVRRLQEFEQKAAKAE